MNHAPLYWDASNGVHHSFEHCAECNHAADHKSVIYESDNPNIAAAIAVMQQHENAIRDQAVGTVLREMKDPHIVDYWTLRTRADTERIRADHNQQQLEETQRVLRGVQNELDRLRSEVDRLQTHNDELHASVHSYAHREAYTYDDLTDRIGQFDENYGSTREARNEEGEWWGDMETTYTEARLYNVLKDRVRSLTIQMSEDDDPASSLIHSVYNGALMDTIRIIRGLPCVDHWSDRRMFEPRFGTGMPHIDRAYVPLPGIGMYPHEAANRIWDLRLIANPHRLDGEPCHPTTEEAFLYNQALVDAMHAASGKFAIDARWNDWRYTSPKVHFMLQHNPHLSALYGFNLVGEVARPFLIAPLERIPFMDDEEEETARSEMSGTTQLSRTTREWLMHCAVPGSTDQLPTMENWPTPPPDLLFPEDDPRRNGNTRENWVAMHYTHPRNTVNRRDPSIDIDAEDAAELVRLGMERRSPPWAPVEDADSSDDGWSTYGIEEMENHAAESDDGTSSEDAITVSTGSDEQSQAPEDEDDQSSWPSSEPTLHAMTVTGPLAPEVARSATRPVWPSGPRPHYPSADTYCLSGYVTINGLEALTLFDSGSTSLSLTNDFARVARVPLVTLTNPVRIQLGCVGSRSSINFGANVHLEYGPIDEEIYVDIVNIERYDMILGVPWLYRHGISLDFEHRSLLYRGEPMLLLSPGEETRAVSQRTIRRRLTREGGTSSGRNSRSG